MFSHHYCNKIIKDLKHCPPHTHLWAGFGAVHDGVAPVDREGVPELVQALLGAAVPGVDDPAVGLHQHGGPQVLVAIPPVGGARGAAARAQDALVQSVLKRDNHSY